MAFIPTINSDYLVNKYDIIFEQILSDSSRSKKKVFMPKSM